jgi:hypothetical protein
MSVILKITETPRVEGFNLIVKTPSVADARRFVTGFKPGDYEIAQVKERRSLDANAMMWAICEQIGRVVGIPKEDVYRRAIREVGSYLSFEIGAEQVDDFRDSWCGKGKKKKIGWFVDVVDHASGGKVLVFAYKGSSVYTVKEMSRLLDYIIDDARNVEIEVISEREKSLLLEKWDA